MDSTVEREPGSLDDPREKALRIVEILIEHKARRPVVLKVGELCSFTDYMVLASGRSTRHVQGVAQRLHQDLKEMGEAPFGVEGLDDGLWVLMDYLDVVVNLFYESHRDYYDLEGFWADAQRVDLAEVVPDKLLAESSGADEPW